MKETAQHNPGDDSGDPEEKRQRELLAWEAQEFVDPGKPRREARNFDKGWPVYGSGEVPIAKTREVQGQDGRWYWVEEFRLDANQEVLQNNFAVTIRDKLAAGAQMLGTVTFPEVDFVEKSGSSITSVHLFFAREQTSSVPPPPEPTQ